MLGETVEENYLGLMHIFNNSVEPLDGKYYKTGEYYHLFFDEEGKLFNLDENTPASDSRSPEEILEGAGITDEKYIKFVKACLRPNPKKRVTAKSAITKYFA